MKSGYRTPVCLSIYLANFMDDATCLNCQKRKKVSDSGGGFVTQFLNICLCDSPVADEQALSVSLCYLCGKSTERGRDGSLTQWIFRFDLCKCQHPSPLQQSEFEPLPQVPEESELLVDEKSFPYTKYKPISELGKGSTGTVYYCKHRQLDKPVALKMLRLLSPEQIIAFQQEARAISRLNHPNIIQILDFGPTEEGLPYMVLEFGAGITLAEYLSESGSLSVSDMVYLFIPILDGLIHAHEAGVLHRDLKPSNILLFSTADGERQVKLIDFGLARINVESQETTLVQGRQLVGTPSYLPPELIQHNRFDHRSDIYSLGCTMFEALTGKTPFISPTPFETAQKHVNDQPPTLAQATSKEFPRTLEKLVADCLAKHPDDRPPSMRVLKDKLIAVAESPSEVPAKTSNRLLVTVLILAITVGTCVLIAIKPNALFDTTNSHKRMKSAVEKKSATPDENRKRTNKISTPQLHLLRSEATMGVADAQLKLGEALETGNGVDKNPEEAFSWYIKAAEQGLPAAENRVAHCYFRGKGVERSPHNSFKWLLKAADHGVVDAQVNVGNLYENGLGTQRDLSKAMAMYTRASEQGNIVAFRCRGFLHMYGPGKLRNYQQAYYWTKKAIDAGDTQALFILGNLYENGLYVKKDLKKALEVYHEAADHGCPEAETMIGILYLNDPNHDYEKAIKWFKRAAAHGDTNGQVQLALVFEENKIVPRDMDEALRWWHKAAAGGDPRGQCALGYRYCNGIGVAKDYQTAMNWFRLAAAQDDASAQTNLGIMYEAGLGVTKSTQKAKEWYQKAAQQGYLDAQQLLARLSH
ncbi:MAG: protein kinase [Candidatus Obscuribacterales bacterium]|nr:protein kinase [Candidatus Obscuribacterales bacterium]